jgi:hypothetical protein
MMPDEESLIDWPLCRDALRLLFIGIFGVWANSVSAQAVSSTITITSPISGTVVVPGQTLQVSVSARTGFKAIQVIGEDIGITPPQQTPPYSFVITIPNNIIGPKQVTALGIVGPESGVFSQSVIVDVEVQTPLTHLNATPSRVNFNFVGDQVNLTVIGQFSDGTEADITRSSKTTYQTNNATVANVNSGGVLTATGVGTTGILVKYGGAVAAVPVAVRAAFAGTPGSADCQGKSVSALAQRYGGIDTAATALGYSNVQALQDAVRAYCR